MFINLKNSLLKSKASAQLTDQIVSEIEEKLGPESSTKEIYQKAFELLHQKSKKTAFRYSFRRSFLMLGPSGFPFEKFIKKINIIKKFFFIFVKS